MRLHDVQRLMERETVFDEYQMLGDVLFRARRLRASLDYFVLPISVATLAVNREELRLLRAVVSFDGRNGVTLDPMSGRLQVYGMDVGLR